MKQIKDPIHGYIQIADELVENIVDRKPYQRLRNLKQLSATYLVYPSANHTRFEHSIGVYYLARKAFESVSGEAGFRDGVDAEEIERTLLSAALLHDVGHPPYSHIGEQFLDKEEIRAELERYDFLAAFEDAGVQSGLGNDDIIDEKAAHELLGCLVILEHYGDILETKIEVDPYEVCGYVLGVSLRGEAGGGWQHSVAADILSSPMDVDRLDYITRDNAMSGADISNVDTERMVASYTTCERSLTFSDKALSAIGNYLEGRISVYMWITQHHKAVYANALLRELIGELDEKMDGKLFTIEKVLHDQIGDHYVMQKLREHAREEPDSRLGRLYDRYVSRDLMNSVWKHRMAYQNTIDTEVQEPFEIEVDTKENEVQENLVRELELDRDELWVEMSYVPEYQPSELHNIHVAYRGEKRGISDIGLYEERGYPGPTPYIFTPKEHQRAVCSIINEAY